LTEIREADNKGEKKIKRAMDQIYIQPNNKGGRGELLHQNV